MKYPTMNEAFYVVNCHINGEYRDTQHFGVREDATRCAARSSRYPMICGVFSNCENEPIETWCKGSYFRSYHSALAHAGIQA